MVEGTGQTMKVCKWRKEVVGWPTTRAGFSKVKSNKQ